VAEPGLDEKIGRVCGRKMSGKDKKSSSPADSMQVTQQHGIGNTSVQVTGNFVSVAVGQQSVLHLFRYHRFTSNSAARFQVLAPYNRTARFVGRQTELSALTAWLATPDLISVRLLIGTVGMGKTRLAIELAADAERKGWTAGFLRAAELKRFVAQSNAGEWGWTGLTLAIVDYASQKAQSLRDWMEILQDYKEHQPHSDAKLRILLLDRVASEQSGWWSNVIGPAGTWSDRRIELCDPPTPITLQSITDEPSCLSIVQDYITAGINSHADARDVFERIRNSANAAQVVSNPLLLQVAAEASAIGEAETVSYSEETLLGEVIDRELANMRKEWAQVGVPEYAASDLIRLAGLVTLMQGATIDEILKILDAEPSFAKLVLFIDKKQILSFLGSVLNTDEELNLQPLEPDLVGGMFALRCDLAPRDIAKAYRLKPLSVGPAIWRIAADFSKDRAARPIIREWVGGVFRTLEDSATALDGFIIDNIFGTPEIVQPLMAEAYGKITKSLKSGGDTTESLLSGNRASLIPLALIREANALVASHQAAKAAEKIQEARSALLAFATPDSFTWFKLYTVELRCNHAQGVNATEQLPLLDEDIDFCRRKISTKQFFEGGPLFIADLQLGALENELEKQKMSSRGLRLLTNYGTYPDFRLSFGDLILSRIEVESAPRVIATEALGYLEEMIGDAVYDRLRQCSDSWLDLARKGRKKGRVEYAEIVEEAADRITRIAQVFRSKTIYAVVKLSGHVSAACKDDELTLRRSIADQMVKCFTLFTEQGFVPDPQLLAELCLSMLLGRPDAPTELWRRIWALYVNIKKAGPSSENVEQITDLIREVSCVTDFLGSDKLNSSLARNTASDVLSAAHGPGWMTA
jgi:hypothetical protein